MAQLKNTTINDTGFLRLPAGTTTQRPTAAAGQLRFNTTTGRAEFYNSSTGSWIGFANIGVSATGGNTVYDIDMEGTVYRVHVFTSGTGSFIVSHGGSVEYLIVAGGGAGGGYGGNDGSGGGGAGGLITGSTTVTPQTYSIVVGDGGAGTGGSIRGNNGGNSSAFGLTAIGGGGGGSEGALRPGAAGGSGGGAGGYAMSHVGGAGTSGQGNKGGDNYYTDANNLGGGGGGGAGAPGQNGSSGVSPYLGNGGDGVSSSITGTIVYYAAGGGCGGGYDGNGGFGGFGGGGNGGGGTARQIGGIPGTPNTGSGGGGSGGINRPNGGGTSGAGGSGIVIIRYPLRQENPVSSSAKKLEKDTFFSFDISSPVTYPGSGTTVFDQSANNNNGTLSGTYTYLDSRTSRANFNFNGGGITTSTLLTDSYWQPSQSYSFEVWVKLTSYPQPAPANGYGSTEKSGTLIGGTNYGGTSIYWDGNAAGTTCYIYAYIRDNVTSVSAGGYNPPLNTWVHLVMTNDRRAGVNQLRFYVNGSINGTTSHSMSGSYIYGPGLLEIPKADVSGGGTRNYVKLPCQIAVARAYTSYLTDSDVSRLYNSERWRFGV